MKFILPALFISMITLSAQARSQGQDRGGGDPCEDRIKIIRNDLISWINKGGAKGLQLPSSLTEEQYSTAMLEQMEKASIRCVGPNDEGYPVTVDGTPKVCRFDRTARASRITCDFAKFDATKEEKQYELIHHEYAGLAGLESPRGSDSNYFLSNQISAQLVDQVVKKLAVKERSSLKKIENHKEKLALQTAISQALDNRPLKCTSNAGLPPTHMSPYASGIMSSRDVYTDTRNEEPIVIFQEDTSYEKVVFTIRLSKDEKRINSMVRVFSLRTEVNKGTLLDPRYVSTYVMKETITCQ